MFETNEKDKNNHKWLYIDSDNNKIPFDQSVVDIFTVSKFRNESIFLFQLFIHKNILDLRI